jgi:hypothetical protein
MQDKKTRKLICVVTGRALLATRDYYERKLERAGSEDKLHGTYICKEAKDLLTKGYTVEKIREMLNVNMDNVGDVSQETVSEVLNSRNNTYRKINVFNTTNNLLNFKTDPEVTQLINNLKNEQTTNSNTRLS